MIRERGFKVSIATRFLHGLRFKNNFGTLLCKEHSTKCIIKFGSVVKGKKGTPGDGIAFSSKLKHIHVTYICVQHFVNVRLFNDRSNKFPFYLSESNIHLGESKGLVFIKRK